jgi:hypothetical protein
MRFTKAYVLFYYLTLTAEYRAFIVMLVLAISFSDDWSSFRLYHTISG